MSNPDERLVLELCRMPNEAEWVEFKLNDADPKEIGTYISALANSTALSGKSKGYVIWGIDDKTHEIFGTSFNPSSSKIGNEDLENWLLRLLEPKISFHFYVLEIAGKRVVLLEVGSAFRHPVRFEGQEYIRVGTYKGAPLVSTDRLLDCPPRSRNVIRPFEEDAAPKMRKYVPFWVEPRS